MNQEGRGKVFPSWHRQVSKPVMSLVSLISRCLKGPPVFRKTVGSWALTGGGVLLLKRCWELAMLLLEPLTGFWVKSHSQIWGPESAHRVGSRWGWGGFWHRLCCREAVPLVTGASYTVGLVFWGVLGIHLRCQDEGPEYPPFTFKFLDILEGSLFWLRKTILLFISVYELTIIYWSYRFRNLNST